MVHWDSVVVVLLCVHWLLWSSVIHFMVILLVVWLSLINLLEQVLWHWRLVHLLVVVLHLLLTVRMLDVLDMLIVNVTVITLRVTVRGACL